MNNRERFLKYMNYESVDHPPLMIPGGEWPETRARWEDEGLPPTMSVYDYFEVEPFLHKQVPIETMTYPRAEETILEEIDGYIIYYDNRGVKCRKPKGAFTMPEHLE